MTSETAGSSMGSAPRWRMRTPAAPRVVTWVPTRSRISSPDQPVLDSIRCDSYSLENKMVAPSISVRIRAPSLNASCWLQSAMKGYPRWRHSSVWRRIASGSSAPIRTYSGAPTRATIGASSICRASLIAPG